MKERRILTSTLPCNRVLEVRKKMVDLIKRDQPPAGNGPTPQSPQSSLHDALLQLMQEIGRTVAIAAELEAINAGGTDARR
jgi:hypothetical protein